MKILILFGHPAFEKSSYNKYMVQGLDAIENVTFHDLYENYPEMDIDREIEQELLLTHDCIIFHHPMYWYSAPAIFKEWQDLVLMHDWAYGSKGHALEGKYFMTVVTTGAPKDAFCSQEYQHHTVQEFLVPFHQMAMMCNMVPLPPFVIHGTHLVEDHLLQKAKRSYHTVLKLLSHDSFNFTQVLDMQYMNEIVEEE